jgi:hypothetical protein
MNKIKSASIPAMQVVVLLIVHVSYGYDSPRGIWKHTRKPNTPELWNFERDFAQIEAINLYIEYTSSPEIGSGFQHFSRNSRIAWTFPIHSKNWSTLSTNCDLHDHRDIPFPLSFLPESRVTPPPWLPVFIFLQNPVYFHAHPFHWYLAGPKVCSETNNDSSSSAGSFCLISVWSNILIN